VSYVVTKYGHTMVRCSGCTSAYSLYDHVKCLVFPISDQPNDEDHLCPDCAEEQIRALIAKVEDQAYKLHTYHHIFSKIIEDEIKVTLDENQLEEAWHRIQGVK